MILDGSGRMTVDDETEEVHIGDAIPNKLGGSPDFTTTRKATRNSS